jgi:hypothetical protein
MSLSEDASREDARDLPRSSPGPGAFRRSRSRPYITARARYSASEPALRRRCGEADVARRPGRRGPPRRPSSSSSSSSSPPFDGSSSASRTPWGSVTALATTSREVDVVSRFDDER